MDRGQRAGELVDQLPGVGHTPTRQDHPGSVLPASASATVQPLPMDLSPAPWAITAGTGTPGRGGGRSSAASRSALTTFSVPRAICSDQRSPRACENRNVSREAPLLSLCGSPSKLFPERALQALAIARLRSSPPPRRSASGGGL